MFNMAASQIDILEDSQHQHKIKVHKRVLNWRCNFCNETNETHLKAHENILRNIIKEYALTEVETKHYYAANFKKIGNSIHYKQSLENGGASTQSEKFINCPVLYCPYCQRRCSSDASLQNHLNSKHQTLQVYFKQKDNYLNVHLKTEPGSNIKMDAFILICPFCKFLKKYGSKISFSKHLDDRHKEVCNSTVTKLKEKLGLEKIEYDITEILKLSAALNLIQFEVYEGLHACKAYYDNLRIEEMIHDIKATKYEYEISTNIKNEKIENWLNDSNANPIATNEDDNLDVEKADEETSERKYNKRTTCGSLICSESDSEDSNINNIIELPHNIEINYEGDNILCKYCPNKYQSTNKYAKHLRRTHTFEQQRDTLIICAHCKESKEKFNSTKRYNEHLKIFHPFADDSEKIEADNYISEEQLYKYTVQRSGEIFSTEEIIEDNYTPLCNRAFVHCVLCFAKFDKLERITNHLKNKHEAAPTSQKLIPTKTCTTCQEVIQLRFYKEHAAYHIMDESNWPYMCDTCGQRYRQKRAFTDHLTCHHNIKKKHKCVNCDESFDNLYRWRKHRRTFHPEACNPVQDQIPKPAKKRYRKNTKYADLECPFCSRLLKNSVTMLSHLKIHNKPTDSKHVCSYCQVTFRRADHLKLHIANAHTNDKPFKCEFCDKSFAANYVKTKHIRRVHKTGRTSFECEQCHKTFDTKSRLEIHIKDNHNINQEPQYICPICNEGFLYHRQLMAHSEKAHDKEFSDKITEFIATSKNIKSEQNLDVRNNYYVMEGVQERNYIEEVKAYIVGRSNQDTGGSLGFGPGGSHLKF